MEQVVEFAIRLVVEIVAIMGTIYILFSKYRSEIAGFKTDVAVLKTTVSALKTIIDKNGFMRKDEARGAFEDISNRLGRIENHMMDNNG